MEKLIIYQSSAGSGKTYTLVKEYLKICLKNPNDYKHILAITFTNAASEEMKKRIIESLIALKEGTEKSLELILKEEGVGGNIKENAQKVFDKILHNYSNFSVSTIDSFFHGILRAFSKELKHRIGYDVEMDSGKVLTEIVEELLDNMGNDHEFMRYIEQFVFSNIEDDKGWNIENHIKELGMEIFKERYWNKKNNYNEDITNDNRKSIIKLQKEIKKIKENFEVEMDRFSRRADEIMIAHDLEVDDFSYKKSGVMGYLTNSIRLEEKRYEPGVRTLEARDNPIKWYTKTSLKINEITKALNDGLLDLLSEVLDYYDNNKKKYNTAIEIYKTIYVVGIFQDLLNKLREYQKENNLLLQTDVNKILLDLISLDNAPFIYEKISNRYKYFLIDEFQDTSDFQWKNLLPLIENSLSENNSVVIVGDAKQSIYRWRGGDMKLILESIYHDLKKYEDITKTRNLKTNRRSCKQIVEFNNAFFSDNILEQALEIIKEDEMLPDYEYLQKLYDEENVKQNFSENKEGGYVNISFFEEPEEEMSLREIRNDRIKDILNEVIKDGYSQKDILFLVRKNTEGIETAKLLAELGYDFVSSESLLIKNSPKVKLLISLLRYIKNNKDKLARTEIIYNYLGYLKKSEHDLHSIFMDSSNKNGKLFSGELPAEFFNQEDNSKLASILNNLTVNELTEHLIRIFKLGKNPDPYLLGFQDLVLDYSSKNNPDITSFLKWWEDEQDNYSISISDDTDAINIKSIHKAKGLQNKIVILPQANWDLGFSRTAQFWVTTDEKPFDELDTYFVKASKALDKSYFSDDYRDEYLQTVIDNLNMMYVAFTRAEERLYLIAPDKRGNNIQKLIKHVIENNESFKKSLNGNIFEMGKKIRKINRDVNIDIKTESLRNYVSTNWYKKIIIKPKHKRIKLFRDKDFSFKTNWGILVHEALSYIKTKNDVDDSVLKLLSEGLITNEQRAELKTQIGYVLANDTVKEWFTEDWEVKNETEILLTDGRTIRPDRVIIKNKNVVVIDYKTGAENKEHENQINDYARALSRMDYNSVEKYLLYIGDGDNTDIKIRKV